MAWNVVAVTIRQASVTSTLLGRVGSVYRLISWGTMPIGAVAFGALATHYGPASAFTVGGLAMLAVTLTLAAILSEGLPDRTTSAQVR
jgi:hypothetical protein